MASEMDGKTAERLVRERFYCAYLWRDRDGYSVEGTNQKTAVKHKTSDAAWIDVELRTRPAEPEGTSSFSRSLAAASLSVQLGEAESACVWCGLPQEEHEPETLQCAEGNTCFTGRPTKPEGKAGEAADWREIARDLAKSLKWAFLLARIAQESHRLQRIEHGHLDISGQYKDGERWVGISQQEVDDIEAAQAALNRYKEAAGDE